MKKILAVIILLIAIPLCAVVWAGLDAAGESLINCPSIVSDTQDLTLDVVYPGLVTITDGDLEIKKLAPRIFLNAIGPITPSYIEFYRDDVLRSWIGWLEDEDALQLGAVGGVIKFVVANGLAYITADGNFHTGTLTSNSRLDAKAGGVIGAVDPCAVLDDLAAGGTFNTTLADDIDYKVEIDANGTPDTFKWSDDGGSTWDATGVTITEAAQTLNNGITVTFNANDGHTTGDYWEFTVTVHSPMWLQDAAGDGVVWVGNNGRVGILDDTPSYALDVNGTIRGNALATSGILTVDTINEYTAAAGVTIDGVLLKDNNITTSGYGTFGSYGVRVYDALDEQHLRLRAAAGSVGEADKTLYFNVGGASRTITLSGNPTLANWFDQSVKAAASPTFAGLTADSDSVRITTPKTPASASNTGTEGDVCWDPDYVYVCVATDSWKRSALSSWGIPDYLLLETGDYILLETGDKLRKEN